MLAGEGSETLGRHSCLGTEMMPFGFASGRAGRASRRTGGSDGVSCRIGWGSFFPALFLCYVVASVILARSLPASGQ